MTTPLVQAETLDRVLHLSINRPDVMNALNDDVIDQLVSHLQALDKDHSLSVAVISGLPKAFAAGADISAMQDLGFSDAMLSNLITRNWEGIRSIRKPIIAAVRGYALGGGCELAMMCDVIIAGESAKFGQPEVKLGIPPGAGGTQRLPRAVGKALAMDLCLTARMLNAQDALAAGLISRVVPDEQCLPEALQAAQTMASYSLPTVMMIKACINQAYETPLSSGIAFERQSFYSAFATEDQSIGMKAFLAKQAAIFKHQ